MKRVPIILMMTAVIAAGAFLACNKNKEYPVITPPPQANFTSVSINTYFITSTNTPFKVPISATTVSNKDRNVTLSITSSTGAASGVQYSIASTTAVIPAGKIIDSFPVQGIYAGYTGTRVDTLTFTITGGDLAPSDYNNTYKLVMRKSCDVVGANFLGNYTNTVDFYQGNSIGPAYTASISSFTVTSATTATIVVKNLGLNAWGPFVATDPVLNPGLTATLDYSNPANYKITMPLQNYFDDGSGPSPSTIKASGTFSSCDNTLTFVHTDVYAGGGTYVVTTILRR